MFSCKTPVNHFQIKRGRHHTLVQQSKKEKSPQKPKLSKKKKSQKKIIPIFTQKWKNYIYIPKFKYIKKIRLEKKIRKKN